MRLVMPSVPLLLSFNGGYVDTAGFLALQGLFTAHVTGNFVTLGASLALGTSGAIAKLLALPVFCIVIVVTRLLSFGLPHLKLPVLRTMLGLQVLLLAAGAAMAIRFGPFPDGDRLTAIMTGMILVSAMAIQNAAHRIHMSSAPPSTLMTGTTTQIMIDLADRLRGLPAEAAITTRARMGRMAVAVAVFAFGCAAAALLFSVIGGWCFTLPPAVALLSLVNSEREGRPIT
jgi:uncharacterized membrane protein YoaK (UPF0700 family)